MQNIQVFYQNAIIKIFCQNKDIQFFQMQIFKHFQDTIMQLSK